MGASFVKTLKDKLDALGVSLVAVSKTKPVAQIESIYNLGVRDFGENRVQEMVDKQPLLPDDIRWHMIGNLQKNKVKYIAPFVHLIHSVSSASLLKVINKEARKNDRIIPILLQLSIAKEATKSGLEFNDAALLIQDIANGAYPHVLLKGFMGMATFTDDMEVVRAEFKDLKSFADKMIDEFPVLWEESDTVLSFGMSGDYEIAIEEGANMVRIGSLIFGARVSRLHSK